MDWGKKGQKNIYPLIALHATPLQGPMGKLLMEASLVKTSPWTQTLEFSQLFGP